MQIPSVMPREMTEAHIKPDCNLSSSEVFFSLLLLTPAYWSLVLLNWPTQSFHLYQLQWLTYFRWRSHLPHLVCFNCHRVCFSPWCRSFAQVWILHATHLKWSKRAHRWRLERLLYNSKSIRPPVLDKQHIFATTAACHSQLFCILGRGIAV